MERRRGRTEEIRCEPRRNNNVLVGLGQVSEGLAAKRGVGLCSMVSAATVPFAGLPHVICYPSGSSSHASMEMSEFEVWFVLWNAGLAPSLVESPARWRRLGEHRYC